MTMHPRWCIGAVSARGASQERSFAILELASIPSGLGHAVVAIELRCRSCGYNLQGLAVSNRCPECGAPVEQSVAHALDPDASRLPTLRNPRMVGRGVLWMASCAFLSLLCWMVRPMLRWIDALDSQGVSHLEQLAPPGTMIIAGVMLLASLWGVKLMAPPRSAHETSGLRRDLFMLAGGLAVSGGLMTATAIVQSISGGDASVVPIVLRLLIIAAVMVAMFGLRGVLRVIGDRSRQYRTSRTGRQSIAALVVALAVVAAGRVLQLVPAHSAGDFGMAIAWPKLGGAIVAIGYFMLVIGGAYLVLNAWWISASLRNAPPSVDELLMPPLPEDTTIETHVEPVEFEVKAKGEK